MAKTKGPAPRDSDRGDDWREMRDFESRSNYHYDGRMTSNYREPRYTAVGILLIVLGASAAAVVFLFAPYDHIARDGFLSFVVDSWVGLLFAGPMIWGGIRLVQRQHGKKHVGELEADAARAATRAGSKGAATTPPAPRTTPAPLPDAPRPKPSFALRFFAALLLVGYFLPHYVFIDAYGISAIGLTTGQYRPFALVGPWYLAFLGVLPILLIAATSVPVVARFQHLAGLAVAGLELGMLTVLQRFVDSLGMLPKDMVRGFGSYATLVADLLLFAYLLVHAVLVGVRWMRARRAARTA